MAIDIFQTLKNSVYDLQRADAQNYKQPLKQLARLLNDGNSQTVNKRLACDVELDAFLAKSHETERMYHFNEQACSANFPLTGSSRAAPQARRY